MNLSLYRDAAGTQPASCTLGHLEVAARSFFTLELPWVADASHAYIGGTPGASCVPAGDYQLARHNSELHPNSFALVNPLLGVTHGDAPGMRSCILIHVANYTSELKGCLALGNSRRALNPSEWMCCDSRAAMTLFNNLVPWVDGHVLTIVQR